MKFSVSGLRGRIGKDLNEDEILRYSRAFSLCFNKGRLAVGMDTRDSGYAIKNLVKGSLLWSGHDVYDLSIIPTPAFLRMVKLMNLDGGIIITASHNPPEWNALKFAFGDRLGGERDIEKIRNNLGKQIQTSEFGREFIVDEVINIYISSLDRDEFDLKGLRIAVDCQNGATSGWVDEILRYLGADVISVRSGKGPIPDDPEPKPESFSMLNHLLLNGDVDIGFGFDPDGDRVICGIKGLGILTEEKTTALALYSAGKIFNPPKKAVINFSTSLISEKVLKDMGFEVYRSKVGEPNVIDTMEKFGAKLGGEGNGGLIYYDFTKGRDGILAAIVISKVFKVEGFPDRILNYHSNMVKLKLPEDFQLNNIKPLVEGWEFSDMDGYYYRNGDNWLHIRKSNTEPIIRVVAEGEENFIKKLLHALRDSSL